MKPLPLRACIQNALIGRTQRICAGASAEMQTTTTPSTEQPLATCRAAVTPATFAGATKRAALSCATDKA